MSEFHLKNRSLPPDLKIIVLTAKKVIVGEGESRACHSLMRWAWK